MNREQAVNIIKEIFDQCETVEGKSIKLMPPKDNNALSNTFQIHIQLNHSASDELVETCVKYIAEKHKLAVEAKNGWLIMFKPYPTKN
jgi:hypothetical protein